MKNMTLRKIAQALGGRLYGGDSEQADREVQGVVIDNRQVQKDDLFIPIRGARVDGHTFIADALDRGALGALSDHILPETEAPYILVEDTQKALRDLASYYRSQIDAYVIGIVGSVGKTSTKEMVASVLGQHYHVLKTQGNFNNEIGLPLTLFRIRPEHQVAVVEMGISDFGEMNRLGAMARPDMVIMTNIGLCHLENLGSRDGILKAKSEVFAHMPSDGKILLNGDDDKLGTADTLGLETHYFGLEKEEFTAEDLRSTLESVTAKICTPEWKQEVCIPIPGKHNVYNALAATAAGTLLDLTEEEILRGIRQAETISGRNNFIKAGNMLVIDDCYNANPVSMQASLEVLGHGEGRKVAILGDMGELGTDEESLHYQVGAAVMDNHIDLLLTAGPLARKIADYIRDHEGTLEVHSYDDKEGLRQELSQYLKDGDVILVKASHFMDFHEIVKDITE